MTSPHRIRLTINGDVHDLEVDVRATLLDVLREQTGLTGTKKGCDHGLCGACTVERDGERVLSCLTLAVAVDGADVGTVEGLAHGGALDPMQRAFLDHDGLQCGYCTPGQLCSARAVLREYARGDLSAASFDGDSSEIQHGPRCLSHDEIRERMAGNICRCGAYANIVAAISAVQEGP